MQYNCKVIDYGDTFHVQFYSRNIEREDNKDINLREDIINDSQFEQQEIIERSEEEKARCIKVSQNRSKNNLYKIARSNKWDYFITLTFDRNKVDSSNYQLVQKKLKTYMSNLRRRNPDLKYLFVPEFHKDGIHYHFHGLLANCNDLIFVDSGHKDFLNNTIYNITNWSFGFTTATIVKDSSRVSSYIGKYITKDLLNTLPNQHRYYASRNCNVCEEIFYNIPYDDFMNEFLDDIQYMKSVAVPMSGQIIKYFEIKKRENKND